MKKLAVYFRIVDYLILYVFNALSTRGQPQTIMIKLATLRCLSCMLSKDVILYCSHNNIDEYATFEEKERHFDQ